MSAEQEEKIPCEECAKHIPRSAAITFEGTEYTHYFCCTQCMDYWKEKHPDDVSGGDSAG